MQLSWLMLGLACAMPWNALITSSNFYDQVFENRKDLSDVVESGITICYLSSNLLSYLVMQAMGPPRHSLAIRGFISFNLVVFVVLTALSLVDVEGTEVALFVLLLSSSIGLGTLSAAYQSAIFALAAGKGPDKTRFIVVGFAVAGTLTSVLAIALSSVDAKFTGMTLFLTTLLFVALGGRVDLEIDDREYFGVSNDSSMEPITMLEHGEGAGRPSLESLDLPPVPSQPRYHLWLCLGTIFLALGGTLSVFPALVSKFVPLEEPDSAFVPVLFLFFNLGDMVGRAAADPLVRWSPWIVFALAGARTAQLPLFLLVKRENQTGMDFAIGDSGVRALVLANGLMNGALYAAAAGKAPLTRPDDAARAGRLSALCSGVALAVGSVIGGAVTVAIT